MFDAPSWRQKKHVPGSFLDSLAIREGNLSKQAGTSRSKWQVRYVVLRRGFLEYYADQFAWVEKKPKGTLSLLDGKVEDMNETESGKPFTIAFSHASSKRVYLFMAANREEQFAWLDAIRVEIAKTKKRANITPTEVLSCEKKGYALTQVSKQQKWEMKYIVIRGGVVELYEEQSHWHEKKQPKLTFVLFGSQVVKVPEQEFGKPFAFNLIFQVSNTNNNNNVEKVVQFAAFDFEEQSEWVKAIDEEINRSNKRIRQDSESLGERPKLSEEELKIQLETLQQTFTELLSALEAKTDEKSRELCERSIEDVREEINMLLSLQKEAGDLAEKPKKELFSESITSRKDVIHVLHSLSKQLTKLPESDDDATSLKESVELLDQIVTILEGPKNKPVFTTYLDHRARKMLTLSPRLSPQPPATSASRNNMPKSNTRYGTLTPESKGGWLAQKLASAKPTRGLRETLRTLTDKKEEGGKGGLRPKLQIFDVDLSQLTLGAVLGSGATGIVYAATYYDQIVAVKKLHAHIAQEPDVIESFIQEAEIWKPLTFRSILQLYGVCLDPGNVCLVMEMGAMSLSDLLYKEALYPDLPWSRRLTIAKEMAGALLYMHAKGVVHRDIKSMNILITSDHASKICDFGMARMLDDLEASHDATSPDRVNTPEEVTGTPQWLAPEVGEGEMYTKAADVFSFGVVLWEIAARQLPYADDAVLNPSLFMSQISKGMRPSLSAIKSAPNPQVSERFIALAVKCWNPVPRERPSFDVILAELTAILDLETNRDRFKETEAELSLAKGKEAFDKKEYDAAQKHYLYSLQCAATPEAYVNLWLCYMSCNKSTEALGLCSDWIRDFPKSMAAYLKRGDTHMYLKQFTEAHAAYTTAHSFDPYNGGLAIKMKAVKKNMALALDLSTAAILSKKMVNRAQIPPPPKRAPPPRPVVSPSAALLTSDTRDSDHLPAKRASLPFNTLTSVPSPRAPSRTPYDTLRPTARKSRVSEEVTLAVEPAEPTSSANVEEIPDLSLDSLPTSPGPKKGSLKVNAGPPNRPPPLRTVKPAFLKANSAT